MSKATFSVTYEGPTTEDGEVPIDQLAPSLLAIGDLFAVATSAIHGEGTRSVASVYAHRKATSAEVSISVEFVSIVGKLKELLAGDDGTAAANLITILLFVGGSTGALGLVPFIRWCRNRRFTVGAANDNDAVTVETEDGSKVVVQQHVTNLLLGSGRVNITQKVYNIVRPLEQQGTEQITFSAKGHQPQRVTEPDLPSFAPWEEEVVEQVEGVRKDMMLTVVQLTFKEGNRWRLSDGNVEFWAAINDEEFLKDVRCRRELFGHGDILKCDVEVRQHIDQQQQLRTSYSVEKVRQHLPGPQPGELCLPEPGDPTPPAE